MRHLLEAWPEAADYGLKNGDAATRDFAAEEIRSLSGTYLALALAGILSAKREQAADQPQPGGLAV